MKIKHNPSIELFCSLLIYARWDEVKSMCEPSYYLSDELTLWYEKTSSALPGTLKNDISYLVSNFLGLTFLPVSMILKEGWSAVMETLNQLKSIPTGEVLPKMLFDTYQTDISYSKVSRDPVAIRKALEKAGGTIRQGEVELFLEFIRYPDIFWNKLITIAESFYALALKEDEARISKKVQKQIQADQTLLDKDPGHFFEAYCRCNRPESEEYPEIYISYYDEVDIIQIEAPDSLIYGRCRPIMENSNPVPLEEAYKILADESRRTILQLLCSRPWFIRELATELKITSATVSYHVSRLAALHLVNYERGEKNRVYYRGDQERIEAMLDAVKKSILG
ncbi:MAG: winged helix-turn-helix transcriptional regulator [Spirochaetales bacterium]|nr:winged helix-turn-helix transcriptional regulator [Spirochaetales bacterium]